jgi:hypothetical protein
MAEWERRHSEIWSIDLEGVTPCEEGVVNATQFDRQCQLICWLVRLPQVLTVRYLSSADITG